VNEHAEAGAVLEKAVKEAFPTATTRLEELAGSACLDVFLPEYKPREEWANIFVRIVDKRPEYGFSIVDKDTGYGSGCDCVFGHIPTLVKFMKRIFPDMGPDLAKLAYNTLPPHPANLRDEPERVCRVCGYTFDRDAPDCPGTILRAAMRP
jgi:hypothetical protein